MKIDFDATDARQVKAAHAAIVSLMNGGGTAVPAASPTPTPTPTPATSTAPSTAPSAAAPTPQTTAAPAAAAGQPVDMAAATAAFQAFVKGNGPGKAKAIIEEFGVKSVKDIPADQLGAFVAKLQA